MLLIVVVLLCAVLCVGYEIRKELKWIAFLNTKQDLEEDNPKDSRESVQQYSLRIQTYILDQRTN
uniref:Transmembrane protein n=1 Tax=Pithovirus LCPAC401 TaxID=2506595 RepID=A0A481Z9J9_9VIRU|nr:MAG: hypothetical protein LCPAC401_02120 [Pithovirus LCPAC401]